MITAIDHIVLTVRSLEATCRFYEGALGFRRLDEAGRPTALLFGTQKFNIHEVGRTFEPKARNPTPGSAGFCLVTDRPIGELQHHLESRGITIELGPVPRTGARGVMTSLYFRDPDNNLVEVSAYETPDR